MQHLGHLQHLGDIGAFAMYWEMLGRSQILGRSTLCSTWEILGAFTMSMPE